MLISNFTGLAPGCIEAYCSYRYAKYRYTVRTGIPLTVYRYFAYRYYRYCRLFGQNSATFDTKSLANSAKLWANFNTPKLRSLPSLGQAEAPAEPPPAAGGPGSSGGREASAAAPPPAPPAAAALPPAPVLPGTAGKEAAHPHCV